MKTCMNCSSILDEDASFCASCATPVLKTVHCPNCSKTINTDARFCKYCAFDLSKPVQKSTPGYVLNIDDKSPSEKNEADTDHPTSLISPSGAAFAVICFFLPWMRFCDSNVTGAEFAEQLPSLWLVPLLGIVAFAAYFICKIQKVLFRAIPFIIGSSAIALGILIYHSRWGIGEFFSGNFKVLGVLKFGSYGTVFGFVLAMAGCIFISRSIVNGKLNDTNFENN